MKWISVADRLPEKSGNVLVCRMYGHYGFISTAFYSARHQVFSCLDYEKEDEVPDDTKAYSDRVAFWAQFPKGPKGVTVYAGFC